MINGVQIARLQQHNDGRGYFIENIRVTDPFFDGFGQWSESFMYQGVIKAWHLHNKQIDYWRVSYGVVRAVLYDIRKNSTTFERIDEYIMGNNAPFILKIPPGVAHGLKVLQGPAILSYITSHTYNPDDELRIPYDDEGIGYDWHGEVIK
jgi:dTDP-4-dehydrorhamnose 3,5-epimerase